MVCAWELQFHHIPPKKRLVISTRTLTAKVGVYPRMLKEKDVAYHTNYLLT